MVSGEICELPGCRNPRKVKPVQKAIVLVPLRMAVHTALVVHPYLATGFAPFFHLQMEISQPAFVTWSVEHVYSTKSL